MVKKTHRDPGWNRDNPGCKNANPGSKNEFPKQNVVCQTLLERNLKNLRAQIDSSRRELQIRFFRGF